MEMDPVSKLLLKLRLITQRQKIKNLKANEKTLLAEILTPKNRVKGDVEILKEQLKAAESKEVRSGKKLQDLTEKLEQLINGIKSRLQTIKKADLKNCKKLQKIDKLIKECGKIIQDNFQKADKFKTLTLQKYRFEALKKSLESDRKQVAKEIINTGKYTIYLAGLLKNLQKKQSKLQIDKFNADSQLRKDTTQ
ncbi:unnamed protein product [Orchesella dallaii]|uniref:Uncharacterized protein n=1 Tax=Orchesella dallaii TaxID=48710 RepID=A0ABP1RHX5_9HEXA